MRTRIVDPKYLRERRRRKKFIICIIFYLLILFFLFLFCVISSQLFCVFSPRSRRTYTVPEAPPQNVTAEAISPTSILVQWQPPLSDRSNGQIIYYKVMATESGMSDSEAEPVRVENVTTHILEDLKRWTEYKIWVLAGTSVGDGPSSYPITIRTREDGKHSEAISHTLRFYSHIFNIYTLTHTQHHTMKAVFAGGI